MPLPDARVIMGAKSYAYNITHGWTPEEAQNYLADRLALTGSQVRSAIRQAQRAMRVGAVLETLRPEDTVRAALEGQRAPARTVGVRVDVQQWQTPEPIGDPWRTNTLYVEVPWNATLQEVMDRAREWIETRPGNSYGVRSIVIEFSGPTLWPGGTEGV